MECTGLCLAIGLWLTQHQYEPFQRDAILKSIWVESRFESCIISKSGSYLAQWAGPRLAWIRHHHPGCPPWQWQMERLDYELRNEPAYGCFWRARSYLGAYQMFRRGFEHGKC